MGSVGLFWGLLAPLACVVVISAGQILFKFAAMRLNLRDPLSAPDGLVVLGVALAVYAAATVLWVAVLRHAPLSRVYPLVALSFVLTPIGATLLLKEPIPNVYWAGVGLILAGLVVISRAPAG